MNDSILSPDYDQGIDAAGFPSIVSGIIESQRIHILKLKQMLADVVAERDALKKEFLIRRKSLERSLR